MKLRRALGVWAGLLVMAPALVRADQAAATTATPGQPAVPSGPAMADAAAETTGKPGAGHPAEPAPAAPASPVTEAPAKDWSVTIGADYYSEYIFRGVDLLKNQPVFVPSVVAKYKNVTAYYYGYYGDGNDALKGNKTYEETDLAIDYTQPLLDGKLSLTAGAYWYLYFDRISGADTFEFYGKASYACYFNPYIGINEDIDTFHGGYGVVGITHTYEIGKLFGLKEGVLTVVPTAQLGIDLGYNSRKTQSDVNWNDVLLGFSVPYYITPAFCVHAGYQVSVALNSLNDIGQHNESIANVGISYAF